MAGRRLTQPAACSYACPARSTVASSKGRPTIASASGSPWVENPQGKDNAGSPSPLKGRVRREKRPIFLKMVGRGTIAAVARGCSAPLMCGRRKDVRCDITALSLEVLRDRAGEIVAAGAATLHGKFPLGMIAARSAQMGQAMSAATKPTMNSGEQMKSSTR